MAFTLRDAAGSLKACILAAASKPFSWISSAVLLPLGIFFTYKAMHDSALFNLDAYRNFFRKVFNIKDSRHYELKEVIIDEVDVFGAIEKAYLLQYKCEQLMEQFSRMSYKRFWNNGINNELIDEVISEQESLITNLTNSREILMINKISQYPIIDSYKIFALTKNKRVAKWLEIIFPIGIPIFLLAIKLQNDLSSKIKIVMKVNREVIDLLENKESNTIINNTFS